MRLALRRVAALALLGLVGLSACGGGSEQDDRSEYALGVPVWSASCAEWKQAGPQARKAALLELESVRHQQLSGRGVGRGYGSVLDEDVAYKLFDTQCEQANADSFLLYRLYGFAAGFVGKPG